VLRRSFLRCCISSLSQWRDCGVTFPRGQPRKISHTKNDKRGRTYSISLRFIRHVLSGYCTHASSSCKHRAFSKALVASCRVMLDWSVRVLNSVYLMCPSRPCGFTCPDQGLHQLISFGVSTKKRQAAAKIYEGVGKNDSRSPYRFECSAIL